MKCAFKNFIVFLFCLLSAEASTYIQASADGIYKRNYPIAVPENCLVRKIYSDISWVEVVYRVKFRSGQVIKMRQESYTPSLAQVASIDLDYTDSEKIPAHTTLWEVIPYSETGNPKANYFNYFPSFYGYAPPVIPENSLLRIIEAGEQNSPYGDTSVFFAWIESYSYQSFPRPFGVGFRLPSHPIPFARSIWKGNQIFLCEVTPIVGDQFSSKVIIERSHNLLEWQPLEIFDVRKSDLKINLRTVVTKIENDLINVAVEQSEDSLIWWPVRSFDFKRQWLEERVFFRSRIIN